MYICYFLVGLETNLQLGSIQKRATPHFAQQTKGHPNDAHEWKCLDGVLEQNMVNKNIPAPSTNSYGTRNYLETSETTMYYIYINIPINEM